MVVPGMLGMPKGNNLSLNLYKSFTDTLRVFVEVNKKINVKNKAVRGV